jgi:hypothetical protein
MQWSFFRRPVTSDDYSKEFNRFLRSVLLLTVHQESVGQGDASF